MPDREWIKGNESRCIYVEAMRGSEYFVMSNVRRV